MPEQSDFTQWKVATHKVPAMAVFSSKVTKVTGNMIRELEAEAGNLYPKVFAHPKRYEILWDIAARGILESGLQFSEYSEEWWDRVEKALADKQFLLIYNL